MVYKLLSVVVFITAVFFYGRSVGIDIATLEQFEHIDELTIKLRKSDESLIMKQQAKSIVQREEVIKYVTKYRDIIKTVPTYIECIDNSGLLDVINATTPTIPNVKTTGVVIDSASIITALH